MMKVQMRTTGKWVVMALSVLFLGACAGTGGSTKSKSHGPVVDRDEARWETLLANDFDSAYEFYSPGYRSSKSRGDFELDMRLRKVHITGVEFLDQSCTENVCNLDFMTSFRTASPVPGIETYNGKQRISEKWIQTDGQWWYYPED